MPEELALAAPVEEQRLEVGLGSAQRGAIRGAEGDELAQVAQRDAAIARDEAQPSAQRGLRRNRPRSAFRVPTSPIISRLSDLS